MSSSLLSIIPSEPCYEIYAMRDMIASFVARLHGLEALWLQHRGEVPEVLSLRAVMFALHESEEAILIVYKVWRDHDVQLTLRNGFYYVRQRIRWAYTRRNRGEAPPPFAGYQAYYITYHPARNSTNTAVASSTRTLPAPRASHLDIPQAGLGFAGDAPPPPGPPVGQRAVLEPNRGYSQGQPPAPEQNTWPPPAPGGAHYGTPTEAPPYEYQSLAASQGYGGADIQYPPPSYPPYQTMHVSPPPPPTEVENALEAAVQLIEVVNKAVSLVIQLGGL
ncbi:hypothetical protein BC834DRAFT_550499 [Gloeopeniophorella convolvens]|nr:hypothetical protein BC834DRAFT_550499 [Gloeopeniophorella convolvens]